MEKKELTSEEKEQLSTIESYKTWTSVERYVPDPLYAPDRNKLKTGVINIPPRIQRRGNSSVQKYIVSAGGKKYLLRTRNISGYEEECRLAAFADRVFREGGAYVSSPVEAGAYLGDTKAYSIYLYYGGRNLARELHEIPTPQQLTYGAEAGKQLKKLQSVLPQEEYDVPDHEEEIFTLIQRLEEKKINYVGFKQACEFIRAHSAITLARPITAVHGDFSANRLFLDKDLNVGIMPLENVCWGDPIKDLASLPDGYSLPFIKGVFKGLYEGELPKELFELLAYYSTVRAFRDIADAEEKDVLPMTIRAERVAADYDNYQSSVPVWY